MHRTLGSLALVAALAREAHAAPSTELPYAAALREAPAGSPAVRTMRAQSDVAEAGIAVAKTYVNPVAAVGTTTDGPRFTSSITVPLPITRRASLVRASTTASAAAAAELPVASLDARQGAANAWCDLWLAERSVQVAAETAQRSTRIAEAARIRFGTGTGARLDVARADAENARLRAEATARGELVGAASAALAYWLGRDAAEPVHTTGTVPSPELPPVGALLARLDTHPIVERAAARSRDATALVSVQKNRVWPTVGVQVGAALADRNEPRNDVSIGVVFDLPILNWNRPAVAQAERAVLRVSAESSAAVARLRADLVAAYAVAKAATVRAEAAEKEILPAARIAADLTRDAYETGAVDLSAVLVAELALANAKQAAFDAAASRGRALAALEYAAGGPL